MSNTSKKAVSIIGIIIGVIIIIIGFGLQDTSDYSIGEPIKFGADFYTEMYAVTKDVGRAINSAINDLINAVSWLIISLGAIDICYFAYNLVKANEPCDTITGNKNASNRLSFAEEKANRKTDNKTKKETAKSAANQTQLSISDFETAASAFLNRHVSISDISCTLIYVVPKSTGIPKEMHLDMTAGDQEFTSLDLFFDRHRKSYFYKGRQLALDGTWRSAEEIFGFDIAHFKNFDTEVDEDD